MTAQANRLIAVPPGSVGLAGDWEVRLPTPHRRPCFQGADRGLTLSTRVASSTLPVLAFRSSHSVRLWFASGRRWGRKGSAGGSGAACLYRRRPLHCTARTHNPQTERQHGESAESCKSWCGCFRPSLGEASHHPPRDPQPGAVPERRSLPCADAARGAVWNRLAFERDEGDRCGTANTTSSRERHAPDLRLTG